MTSCIITPRTAPDALRQYISDLFSANVLKGAPIIPESNEWYVVNNDYAMAEEFRSVADQMLREFDDTQCCDETLFARAAQYGLYPSPGTFSVGFVEATGTPGAALPQTFDAVIGDVSFSRAPYSTSATTIGPDGTAAILMRASQPGSVGNISAGAAGGLLQNLDGVNSTLTVLGASFCNGTDAETVDQFRARYLARKAYAPKGGWADLVELARSFGCVTRLCPRTSGTCNTGRLEFYAMFDWIFPNGLAPDSVNDDLTKYLFGERQGMGLGKADIGVFGKAFTAQAAPIVVNIRGLGCLTSAQLSSLRDAINALFLTLCPEQTLCKRLIEALIVTLAGASCLPTITFNTTNAAATISSAGDAVPTADSLITLDHMTLAQ